MQNILTIMHHWQPQQVGLIFTASMTVIGSVTLNALCILLSLNVCFWLQCFPAKTGRDCRLISTLVIKLWMILLGKVFCRTLRKQNENEEKPVRSASEARLIERAGLRKHLPAWRAEHLSDPAHIRWFPCLRYLAAAPCGPATIGCPGPLLFPPHSLIIRGLPSLSFPIRIRWNVPFATLELTRKQRDRFSELKTPSSARTLTPVLITQTRQPWDRFPFPPLAYTWAQWKQGSSISLTDNLDPAVLHVTCIAQP